MLYLGLEHIDELVKSSNHIIQTKYKPFNERIEIRKSDARFEKEGGFDVIHLGAAIETLDESWTDRLSAGGIMVAPVGGRQG